MNVLILPPEYQKTADIPDTETPEQCLSYANSYEHAAKHRVIIHPDDGKPVVFRWHLPRHTLSKRMSGFELAIVLGQHLPAILPFLSNSPRAHAEMDAMVSWIYSRPRIVSDRVLPWIRSMVRTQEHDIVQLSLFDQSPTAERTIRFV